jgi:hypothetical protein
MSGAKIASGLAMSALLTVLAFNIAIASAETFSPLALNVCKKVPAGEKGLWNTSNCGGTNVASGEYAWSVADNAGKATIYCALGGSAFTEDLCSKLGSSGPFKEKLSAEAFPKLLGAGGLAVFKASIASLKTEVDCKKNEFSGQPATARLLIQARITFLECKSTKPANCEVNSVGEPAGTIASTGLVGEPSSSLTSVSFHPESGTTFTEIEATGASCALKGTKLPVTGSQTCEFEATAAESAQEHALICKASGSKLKLGSETATAEGDANVMVEGGLFWQMSPPPPVLRVCRKVPTGEKGLWNTSNCDGTNVANGEYAWSVADDAGKATIYCVLGGTTFTEGLCEALGSSGPFKEKLFAEAFPKLLGAGGLAVFKAQVTGEKTEVDCKKNEFSGQPASAALLIEAKITFLECTPTKPVGCAVNSAGESVGTIASTGLEGEPSSSLSSVTFHQESGATFVEIEFTGASCVLKGTKAVVTGTQTCEFELTATESAEEHTLTCKASGSKLVLGGESATAEGNASVMVEGARFWTIR